MGIAVYIALSASLLVPVIMLVRRLQAQLLPRGVALRKIAVYLIADTLLTILFIVWFMRQ